MSLSFSVLGSGSAGNCTVLVITPASASSDDGTAYPDVPSRGTHSRRCILIDAGLSPRRTARHLADLGLSIRGVTDIVLTHLDTDHFYCGWVKAIENLNITVHAHHKHRTATYAAGIEIQRTRFFTGAFALESSIAFQPVNFAHDNQGSIGYVIEHAGLRLGFATDLGRVPESLYDHFRDLHALAFESNYDRKMQLDSLRPPFLKRRIMSGSGHLSNDQALEAIERIEAQSVLSSITLLHLSQECNCPDLLRRLYAHRAPHLAECLSISSQHEPTPLVQVVPGIRRARAHAGAKAVVQPLLFSSLGGAGGQPTALGAAFAG